MVKKKTNESPSPSGSTRSEKKSKHFLAAQKFLEETKGVGFVNELKSLLDPKNLTGANAIESALNVNGKGAGLSATQRVTSGLTGVVQGLSLASGGGIGNKYKRDIGLHVSPNPNIKNKITFSPERMNTGAKGTPMYPVIADQTYKFSSAKKITQGPNSFKTKRMIQKARRYGEDFFNKEGYTVYVTESRFGKVDPETRISGSQRIVPEQSIIGKIDYPGGNVGRVQNGWGDVIKDPVRDKQLQQEILKARKQVAVESKLISAQSFAVSSIVTNKLNKKKTKKAAKPKNIAQKTKRYR